MKFLTLYSAKYKKTGLNLRRGKMPLFTVLSFRTPKSAENLNIFSEKAHSVCSTSEWCAYVRPLKETTTHLSVFPNKDTPCGRENEVIQERSRDVPDVVDKKRDCFLVCFVQNIRYLVGTSDVTTISKDQGNVLQILCKTSLEKREYCCVVQMHGLEHTQRFWWFWSDAVVFRLFKVFTLILQHIWCTYRANIRDQLIENTTR